MHLNLSMAILSTPRRCHRRSTLTVQTSHIVVRGTRCGNARA